MNGCNKYELEENMNRFKRLSMKFILVLLILVAYIYLNNSSLLTKTDIGTPLLLAHRGMAQTFLIEGIASDTCTAERIYEPVHPYLENTIPSMEAAFEAGADIVELDIHPIKVMIQMKESNWPSISQHFRRIDWRTSQFMVAICLYMY